MTLPELVLDDRDFQSLVDEARRRIVTRCPEWTEHNVSDPGITLIELFAWMTDILLYRVNRIPEKLQLALMDLLQIGPTAAEEARADLRFLTVPDTRTAVTIPAGTAVAAAEQPGHPPVVFATTTAAEVPLVALSAMGLARGADVKRLPVVDGVVRPSSADRAVFRSPPDPADALLLGFSRPIARLVIDVAVTAIEARGVGVRPAEAPLVWEASVADGSWLPATVVSDTTGGLNQVEGVVRLQVPAGTGAAVLGDRSLHWLRCRVAPPDGKAEHAYVDSPKLVELSVRCAGVLVRASHGHVITDEQLGYSDGTPGQVFPLHHRPALALDDDEETLEVRDPKTGEWERWERRDTLSASTPTDQHFRFDPVAGEVELGPAVRITGGWRQYGEVPLPGAALRMRAYRYGGGSEGNVAAGTLVHLRDAVPGVQSVSNPAPASGGVDAETIEDARQHAARRLRTQNRAVTAGDYRALIERECPRVERVRVGAPVAGQALPVYVLPALAGTTDGPLPAERMQASPAVLDEVATVLRRRCVVGTSVHVTPVRVRVVMAAVEVVVRSERRRAAAERAVAAELYRFINAYVGDRHGNGWDWGRSLYGGELAPIVRDVDVVDAVRFVRLYEVDPATGVPAQQPSYDGVHLKPDELIASARHQVHAVVP